MFARSTVIAALGLALAAGAAQAETHRKPGLWEVQSTQNSPDMAKMPDMQEAMGKMSPEQRAMVERMMKERGVGVGAKPNTFRYCLSKERAERDFAPQTDPDTDCNYSNSQTSSTEAQFSFTCKRKDGSTVNGQGRAYDLTPESYALSMSMQMQHGGKPMQMQMEQKGKWLGADCKGLKPMGG